MCICEYAYACVKKSEYNLPGIGSFLTTPFFALLNYVLVTNEKKNLPTWLKGLAIAGLIFLFGFAIFFIWALAIGKAG